MGVCCAIALGKIVTNNASESIAGARNRRKAVASANDRVTNTLRSVGGEGKARKDQAATSGARLASEKKPTGYQTLRHEARLNNAGTHGRVREDTYVWEKN